MVNGMADGESEKREKALVFAPNTAIVHWVLTPVAGEFEVIVEGGCQFFLVTRAHFCKAAVMWEGSIREKESFIFFVCMFRGRDVFTSNEAYEF
jgi:hypothetical protein